MNANVNPLARPFRPGWSPLVDRSRRLLTEVQSSSGAWPAAPDFAPYGFSWFRDGSFIAEGASAAGLAAQAEAFHAWCAGVLRREEPAVDHVVAALAAGRRLEDGKYLPARYTLAGERHDDDWWNFQVDGYGTWMWALERHLGRTGGDVSPYAEAVATATRYLVATGRDTCRDWWEENREHTHVATLAGVAAGLRAAVRLSCLPEPLARSASTTADAAEADILGAGVLGGRLVKWLGGGDLDASLLAVAAVYDVLPLDHPVVVATADAVRRQLADGGVHRYLADTFYGGGQWPVLASLLAWHEARTGDLEAAASRLDWVVSVADDDLRLPEQVAPMLAPQVLDEWLERWGPSAHPLVWSHGMFLAAVAQVQAAAG